MASYSWLSPAQFIADLAARLQDPLTQQWSAAALQIWINEALREWNALTNFWRTDMVVPVANNTNWYDLTAQPATPRPYTVLDTDIVTQIELHLLEPVALSVWTGSSQFTLADIYGAIQRARDEVLSLTGCVITRLMVDAPTSATRIQLPDSAIDVRRVAWFPLPNLGFAPAILRPGDIAAKQYYDIGYTTNTSAPRSWMRSSEPPFSFDIDRMPAVGGQYEVLVVQAGPALTPGDGIPLGVPDDWSWVVKWGALAQLFGREGTAADPQRADYCRFRYDQGIGLMQAASVVLGGRINNIPASVDAVRNGDDFNPSWETGAAGQPRGIYAAGMNLIGMRQPDGLNAYSASLSVVQNAPVNGTFVQVSREDYTAVLDEAQHIASLQMAGADFAATMGLHKRFIQRAALYSSKLLALGDYPYSMLDRTQTEIERNPTFSKERSPSEVLSG